MNQTYFSLKVIFTLFMLLCCLQNSTAESFIYFQNNSSLSFTVNSEQTGPHAMETNEWWGLSGSTIAPWQLNTNVLWANRNEGIHNGTDFFLTTTLTSGGESIRLKMNLNGNFVGSDMWQSLEGPGFAHSWFGDRNFHEQTFTLNGKTVTVKYSAYAAGTYDDILFAIQEHDPFPVLTSDLADPTIINVLSYNIYMLTPPISFSDQSTRAAHIHDHVNGYDAIIVNEAFDNAARNILTANMSIEYPYYTAVVDESGSFEDGGVLIYSRWPIEYSEGVVFSDCDADDCLAAKGVMYARINKLGKLYHLFGTHTQAWADAANVATRQAQMAQMKTFMDSKNIPATEPVIFGGDFNVEKIGNNLNEYTDMFPILNTEEPDYLGHPYSYDYYVSAYAESPYQEYLDYVMYEKSHQTATIQTNKVIILRSIADAMWDIFDLSDHLAIQGRFEFPTFLPVELTVFEGEPEKEGNFLNWQTINEDNASFFEVQHSTDGLTFTTIATLKAQGNPTESMDYAFTHRFLTSATNYYRLRMVDNAGEESFSKIIVLKNDRSTLSDVNLFPNPVTNVLHLEFNETGTEKVQISIYNTIGQVVEQFSLPLESIGELDVKNYKSGLYFLQLEMNEELKMLSFVKE